MNITITIDDTVDSIDIEHVGAGGTEPAAARATERAVTPPDELSAGPEPEGGPQRTTDSASPLAGGESVEPPTQFQPETGEPPADEAGGESTPEMADVIPAPGQFQEGP